MRLAVVVGLFLMMMSIATQAGATSQAGTTFSDIDITGSVVEEPSFSYSPSIIFLVRVDSIQNYLEHEPTTNPVEEGDLISVQISGDFTKSIKAECYESGRITLPECRETDLLVIFGEWNSYGLSVGDTVSLSATLYGANEETAFWWTQDESISFDECDNDSDCPTISCVTAPCPGYSCVDNRCVLQEVVAGCTEEAKICPDGSSVSRVLPSCEFKECPVIVENASIFRRILNWFRDIF
jgi:hypothetical protein